MHEVYFQTGWNSYVDLRQTFFASKLKLIKGLGYEIYNLKLSEEERKHKSEENAAGNTEDQEVKVVPPVSLLIHVNNFLLSVFF